MASRWLELCISTPCVDRRMTIRPVLYEAHHETQADSPLADLLRGARAVRSPRRGDLVRPQAGDRALDRELLAGSAHDRLRRAGAARRRWLPDRAPGAGRAAAQALRAHRA